MYGRGGILARQLCEYSKYRSKKLSAGECCDTKQAPEKIGNPQFVKLY